MTVYKEAWQQRMATIIKELEEIEQQAHYIYDQIKIGEATIILEKVLGIYE